MALPTNKEFSKSKAVFKALSDTFATWGATTESAAGAVKSLLATTDAAGTVAPPATIPLFVRCVWCGREARAPYEKVCDYHANAPTHNGLTYTAGHYELVGDGTGVIPWLIRPVHDNEPEKAVQRVVARSRVSLFGFSVLVSTVFTGRDQYPHGGSKRKLSVFGTMTGCEKRDDHRTDLPAWRTAWQDKVVRDITNLNGSPKFDYCDCETVPGARLEHDTVVGRIVCLMKRCFNNEAYHNPLPICPELFAGEQSAPQSTLARRKRLFADPQRLSPYKCTAAYSSLNQKQHQHLAETILRLLGTPPSEWITAAEKLTTVYEVWVAALSHASYMLRSSECTVEHLVPAANEQSAHTTQAH